MKTLKDIQRDFVSDCLSRELGAQPLTMEGIVKADTISTKGRMSIYRESAIANISLPLKNTYPVVLDLVGEDFFTQTCRQYIKENWPTSGNLDDYGESFPEFLQKLESVNHLPYLPDMARLEWFFHLSALADDQEAGDWSNFATLTPDDLTQTYISLHPSVFLMQSRHPLLKIWELCKSEEKNETIDISKEAGGHILLVRKDLEVNLYPIEDNEAAFLKALIAGKPLYDAFEDAIAVQEDESIQNFIAKHITIGTFTGYQ